MKIHHSIMSWTLSGMAAFALAVAVVPHEIDAGDIRLGQKVHIDDGTCPAGQIKEIIGAKLTPQGVQRSRKCVSRK